MAPDRQWSGAGRAMPPYVTGQLVEGTVQIEGQCVVAYAVDASPALAAVHGITELASRRPSPVVSGINSGANLGAEVTVSGTVGALGFPALAVSLAMDAAHHLSRDDSADYKAARAFTRLFAECLLSNGMPCDVQALDVNIPSDATPEQTQFDSDVWAVLVDRVVSVTPL